MFNFLKIPSVYKTVFTYYTSLTKNKHIEIECGIDTCLLIKMSFVWSRGHDHAGVSLEVALFGLDLRFNLYDSRHWNSKLNTWANTSKEEYVTNELF